MDASPGALGHTTWRCCHQQHPVHVVHGATCSLVSHWSFYDLPGFDGGCGKESTRDGSETKMYFQVPLIVSIPSSFVLD